MMHDISPKLGSSETGADHSRVHMKGAEVLMESLDRIETHHSCPSGGICIGVVRRSFLLSIHCGEGAVVDCR